MLAAGACAEMPANNQPPMEYLQWLDELKQEMMTRGISKATIDKVYGQNDFYHPQPDAVKHDRRQPEFVLTSAGYLNRLVSKQRAAKAAAKYRELKPQLSKIEAKYNLPAEYIIAFWGAETDFGTTFGGYNVFDALTEMSYDKRRSKFFKNELYYALKIVEEQQLPPEKMQSSWAGAMGNFQFMPTTYDKYAVDFNGNGKIDIWEEFEDAAASAANYLSAIGWEKEIPWGWEVELPWNFDYAQSGRNKAKPLHEWIKQGVKINGLGKVSTDTPAAVIAPDGAKGQVYLVSANFGRIMQWNRSENYALAIGKLADYALSGKKWQPAGYYGHRPLKTDEVVKVQKFINLHSFGKLDEDGQLGSKTKAAVQDLQKKAHLNADGYPDAQLLHKIAEYTKERGFAPPLPPRKLHKPK